MQHMVKYNANHSKTHGQCVSLSDTQNTTPHMLEELAGLRGWCRAAQQLFSKQLHSLMVQLKRAFVALCIAPCRPEHWPCDLFVANQ